MLETLEYFLYYYCECLKIILKFILSSIEVHKIQINTRVVYINLKLYACSGGLRIIGAPICRNLS